MYNVRIVNGPDKQELIKAFADRKTVEMFLENGTSRKLIINSLQHEDGSTFSFNFKTWTGFTGYYDTRKKGGYINFPPATAH